MKPRRLQRETTVSTVEVGAAMPRRVPTVTRGLDGVCDGVCGGVCGAATTRFTGTMDDLPYSQRSTRIQEATPFRQLFDFIRKSDYQARRLEPGVLDFTFGDPHEMPMPEYVEALRQAAVPHDELWFAYKFSQESAQEAAARSLRAVVDLPWEADRIRMTTGGFGAITLAMKAVADPG